MQYNPHIDLEFRVLNDDGSEGATVNLTGNQNLNYYVGNKPITIECNVNKSLAAQQQTADIIIHNSPFIEAFRDNYQAVVSSIRTQKWRVRIWAWFSNSTAPTARPAEPVFIGDIIEDFEITSSSINDSAIRVQALGHGWLMNTGKYKDSWERGTNYLTIVNDLMTYISVDKKYGNGQFVVQDNGRLASTTIKRGFTVNRNPAESLNDICRRFDFLWGVNNLIPYMLPRDGSFSAAEFPISSTVSNPNVFVNDELISLINYSKYTFGYASLWQDNLIIGSIIGETQLPQIFNGDINFGRINDLNIALSNTGDGHTVDVTCAYYDGAVAIPPKREDNSGLRKD